MHIYYFFYLLIEQIKIVINNFQIKPIFQTNFLAKGEKMQESSIIGKSIEEIDTPALLIDLDIMEKNIHTMAEFYAEKKGAALRPHQKGHRLPLVAKTQMDTGACGVSITTLGLAEYYVTCGIDSILLTNEIAGKNKMRRVCTLSKLADITVGVDNLENARHLGSIAGEQNTIIQVGVELYMGTGTCGVEIEEALPFIKELVSMEHIQFNGLWWHQGSLADILDWEERKQAHFATLDRVAHLKDSLEDAGIDVIRFDFLKEKRKAYHTFREWLENGKIFYPKNRHLLQEMKALRYERTPAGQEKIHKPQTGSDDIIDSFVMCFSPLIEEEIGNELLLV